MDSSGIKRLDEQAQNFPFDSHSIEARQTHFPPFSIREYPSTKKLRTHPLIQHD